MKNLFLYIILACYSNGYAQDLSEIFETVSPAVVVIFTEENKIVKREGSSFRAKGRGLGSGLMISEKNVVTAAHVVDVPESVKVQFLDGEIIPAKVISHHKSADVAMLELLWPKENAKVVTFGDSDALKVGNQVFIIGSPFGLGQSLSSGYVSGFKKKSVGTNPFTKAEFIQTDAAINTGNSGGPMFNLNGEVVGVVSHITSVSGGFSGIGFAATSNITSYLLLNNKSPWSGADLYLLTGQKAQMFNLPQSSGLLVQRIVFSSRLGSMGVRDGDIEKIIDGKTVITGGDIILSFNGIEFNDSDETLLKLASFAEGLTEDSNFQITVWREGKIVTLGRK